MNMRLSRQKGAFLAIMTVMIIVILGVSALALDVGRVLVLRSEMQNAVDAAALAAAAQLDGAANAQQRARNAARNALVHNSHFAKVKELLGDVTLPDTAFTFFCIIGAKFDPDTGDAEVDLSTFCGNTTPYGTGADANKYEASGNSDSHYVRVSLEPTDENAEHFTVPLIFLPVLRLLGGGETLDRVILAAEALAGRNFFACNFPPMAICDPFEGSGGFRENMTVGGHIILKQQTPGWAPGNAGFLQLSSPGAGSVAEDLANETDTGCSPPILTTATGGMTNKMKSAINTRFGVYRKPANPPDEIYGDQFNPVDPDFRVNRADELPAAPNVVNYPLDQTTETDPRFGKGDWLCSEYWATHHLPVEVPPIGCLANALTRWEVYNHEIANTLPYIQEDGDASDDLPPVGPERARDTDSSADAQFADRRRLFVGVVSCGALGIAGHDTFPVFDPDGFAKIFLIRPATGPSHPDGAQIFGEYIGWAEEDEGGFHVDIQLYE